MHIYICPDCGAYLDPGERCDCEREQEKKARRQEKQAQEWEKMVVREKDGQLRIAV